MTRWTDAGSGAITLGDKRLTVGGDNSSTGFQVLHPVLEVSRNLEQASRH